MITKIAFRNIFRKRRRSFFTALTIVITYVALSFSLAVADGSYSHIVRLFTAEQTGHVRLHRTGFTDHPQITKSVPLKIPYVRELQQYMKEETQIVAVSSHVRGAALMFAGDKSVAVQVVGIDPAAEARTSQLAAKVRSGLYLDQCDTSGKKPALIGQLIAERAALTVGGEMIMLSQGADGSVANDRFYVCGVVGRAGSPEEKHVYLALPVAQEFFSLGRRVHDTVLLLKDFRAARRVADELSQQLSGFDMTATPWQELAPAFYEALQMDMQSNYALLAILILLSSLGVLISLSLTTAERTQEFGVMLAVGSQRDVVFKLIVSEALLLALFSCTAGLAVAAALNIWLEANGIPLATPLAVGGLPLTVLQGEMSWRSLGLPAAIIVTATFCVSLLPARRASRMQPVTAMKG